jgi:hypothetical protein
MNAHELVMRFIGFWYEKINKAPNVAYQGNMQTFLDSIVDQLNKDQGRLHGKILLDFGNSIDNAAHLFGKYAFRKCLPEHLKPGARGQLVNKSLFTTWSILLVQAPHSKVIDLFPELEYFAKILANELAESRNSNITGLSYYETVSYRTNDRLVLETAFEYTQNLIEKYLIK